MRARPRHTPLADCRCKIQKRAPAFSTIVKDHGLALHTIKHIGVKRDCWAVCPPPRGPHVEIGPGQSEHVVAGGVRKNTGRRLECV